MPSVPQFWNPNAAVCFANRRDAGEQLAQVVLQELAHISSPEALRTVVYALPRGGIPIAQPIAQRLNAPLDLVVAKKITRPENPELAIGAVTADGHVIWATQQLSGGSPVPSARRHLSHLHQTALQEAQARAKAQWAYLMGSCPQADPEGAIALLVDDGIATGMTMAAAAESIRSRQPNQIWICVPVAPPEVLSFLASYSDRVIVLATPSPFYSVSRFYSLFPQVSLEEAQEYLQGRGGEAKGIE